MRKKPITYTENDRLIVEALTNNPKGLTLAELKEITGTNLVSGHIVGAIAKGIVNSTNECKVTIPSKRTVFSYCFVSDEVKTRPDNGKPYTYSDNEKEILSASKNFTEPFILAELSEAMGRKITSGSINWLVKKGNLIKGEPVEVKGTSTNTVKIYTLAEDWKGFEEV